MPDYSQLFTQLTYAYRRLRVDVLRFEHECKQHSKKATPDRSVRVKSARDDLNATIDELKNIISKM
jgi:hypothetical protein